MNKKEKLPRVVLPFGVGGVSKTAEPIIYDPMGSYTGRPMDKNEIPIQDADDL